MDGAGEQWVNAMRRGAFGEAWALSRQALAARDPATRDDPALPYHRRWVWDGGRFDDRDVLVRCYHGLGDTIQFARFLPLLGRRAASVTLEAPARLVPLLAGIEGVDRIIPFDPAHPLPPFACDLEITELAFALEASPDDASAPYLSVPPAPVPAGTIGLCYTAGDWDPARCVPPAMLAGLCEERRCVTLVAEPTTLPVANPAGCPFDMMESASLVAGCDLVVTVDTMIAHLSGALGRPTWLLLKHEPDWRWDPTQRTSPWYPSMRLYAQPHPCDWAGVIAAVESDLAPLPQESTASWPA